MKALQNVLILTSLNVVLGCFLASPDLQAQESLPYQATFEAADGFKSGNIHGQRGFEVIRGQAEIAPHEGINGSASLKLQPSRPFGIVQLSIAAGLDAADSPDQVIHTDFHLRPGAASEAGDSFADVEGSLTGFFRIDDQGELHIYDGSTDDTPGQWLPTGTRFALDEKGSAQDWIRLSFRQDFAAGLWDVAINGNIFRANLAMDRRAMTLEKIEFIGHSHLPLWIDNVMVSRDATAFTDADRDGLPDDWELTFGLPLDAGRSDDADQDGLTNIEELVLGTHPLVADTDGDTLSDHEEYLAGTDALEPNKKQVAASATTSNGLTLDSPSCDGNTISFSVGYEGTSGYYTTLDTVEWISGAAAAIFEPTFKYLSVSYSSSGPYVTVSRDDVLFYGDSFRVGFMAEMSSGSSLLGRFDVTCGCGCGCTTVTAVSSVHIKFGLGKMHFGQYGQNLDIRETTWSPSLYSRTSVRYAGQHREGRAGHSIKRINGRDIPVIDWVKTGTQFTCLRDIEHGYVIEAYHLDQVDQNNRVTGQPFRTHIVENPDPEGTEPDNRLLIREEGARPNFREYRHRIVNGAEEWELYEGGSDYLTRPMRYEKVSKPRERNHTYAGSTLSTEHRQQGRWDPNTQTLVMDEEKQRTYRNYPLLGRYLVREILDPRGQALTTEWGYPARSNAVDFEDNLANFAQLEPQWVSKPDGGWEWYGYDDQARRNRIVKPIGNTPRPAQLPTTLAGYHVTTIDFDRAGENITTTIWNDGHLEKTTHEHRTVENNQLRRELTVTHGEETTSDTTLILSDKHGLVRQENPDGTLITIDRQFEGDLLTETQFNGAADGSYGTETLTIIHRSGLLMEERVTDISSGTLTKHRETLEQDAAFRPLLIADHVTGDFQSKGYDCCDVEWSTGPDGATTVYERDLFGRIIGQQQGYKDPLDRGNTLTTTTATQQFQLDSLGRRIATQQNNTRAAADYNLAGQRTTTTTPTGLLTEYKTLMLDGGGRLELTSLPKSGHDNRHRITSNQYNATGQLEQARTYASHDPFATTPDPGTTVAHTLYEEGIEDKGSYKQTTQIAHLFDRRITRTYFDAHGRQQEIIHAYGTRLAASETFDYNEDGQLIRHIDPDGVTTRYAYNEKGERTTTALDLNVEPNELADHIDSQVDRITLTQTELIAGTADVPVGPLRRTLTQIQTENGLHTTSISIRSLDGTYSATTQNGHTATRRKIDSPIAGTWQIINTQPDGAHTIQSYENGRLTKSTRHDKDGNLISWTSQTYDDQGRPHQITDSRTGTTTTHYNELGQVWKISAPNPSDPASITGTLDTTFTYDALGQRITTTKPSGGQVHQVYNANGTLRKTHGHHTTDVEYRYNGLGERTHMITYYGPDAKESRTIWRNNARGQLAYKQDAAGKRVRYTYTPGGKLETRTWARGVKTNYHYDQAGQLRHIDYSDTTPNVHLTYTRLGQKQTVQDAGGLLTYQYRSENPLELESETRSTTVAQSEAGVPPAPYANRAKDSRNRRSGQSTRASLRQDPSNLATRHSHLYSEPKVLTYLQGNHGRSAGFQIGTPDDPDQDYEARYSYDGVGRLASVSALGYHFRYDYLPNSNSDRLKATTAMFVKKTTYDYEPGRDTLTSVTNNVGFDTDQLLSRYTYEYGPDGQRINRTSQVPSVGLDVTDRFTYDPDTGGVAASTPDTEERDSEAYAYDKIGNRLKATKGNRTTQYKANALNQYTTISDLPSSISRAPAHDADGNQLTKGDQNLIWDAENRLIAIHERGSLLAEYTYDHQSRRIARRVPSLNVDERYLYEGWNLIAVYDAGDPEPEERYTWGKDLSGSIQGAGGVGGLLFAKKRTAAEDVWIYHYDANGNVTELTANTGQLLDQYRYDAFGQTTSATSTMNRYRFSTKPNDRESKHYYYGYRHYDTTSGRWLNRDPIEDICGIQPKSMPEGPTLYALLENDSVNGVDLYGLIDWGRLLESMGLAGHPGQPGGFMNTAPPLSKYVNHYFGGKGKAVTLSEMGDLELIKNAAQSEEIFNRVKEQIKNKIRGEVSQNGDFTLTYETENTYNYQGVVFAIGHTTISTFSDIEGCKDDSSIPYDFTTTFNLSDQFEDPLDIGVEIVGGTIYKISGSWEKTGSGLL